MAPPRGWGWKCSPDFAAAPLGTVEGPAVYRPLVSMSVLFACLFLKISFLGDFLNVIFRFLLSFSFLLLCNFQVNSILFHGIIFSQTINDGFGVGVVYFSFRFSA